MAIEALLANERGRRVAPPAGEEPRGRRWWRPRLVAGRLARGDRVALALLVGFPVLLYLPFSLSGHPVLPGDDLTQNFPLRLLAGELLRSGHLPTWDPLIWSGTPLLAGWNGGSMFPATWLFAVLPGVAAWTVVYVANPIVASLGAYLLLRRLGCGCASSVAGAAAFTYTGFMSGQVVHIGLVEGTALMPWTVLALEVLRRRAAAGEALGRLAGPVALLGLTTGLTVLAGDPRAVTTTAVVDAVYLLALLLRPGGGRGRVLEGAAVAVGLGGLLSAAQWLPGLRFVHGSQRGSTAYQFFGAGSVDLGHIASFVLAPFLFGGNGNLGMPTYSGSYNLPELTIGTGLLATVAFMAFLPALARSGATRLRALAALRPPGRARRESGGALVGRSDDERPTTADGRALGVWYALALVGLLLTLGSDTPLGHLLVHVPLFGAERLQNRNAAIFDLSLAVLLAYLLEDLLGRRSVGPLRSRATKALCLVPLAGAAALVAFAYADPAGLRTFGGVPSRNTSLFTSMTLDNVWLLALVAGAAAIVLRPGAVAGRRGRLGLVLLLAADLGLYLVNANYGGAPSSVVSGRNPVSQAVARLTGPGGRIAVYDPLTHSPPEGPHFLQAAGAPDVNVVASLPSVQGYGSVVASAYDAATRTHGYESLSLGALSGTTFDTLDLRTLVTLPASFATVLAPHQPLPVPGDPVPGAGGTPAAGTPAAVVGGPYRLAGHRSLTFLLPSPMAVRAVRVVLERPAPTYPLEVALAATGAGRLAGTGRTGGQAVRAPVHGRDARVTYPRGPRAGAVTVDNAGGRTLQLTGVVVEAGRPAERLALDGPLQGVLSMPHWRYAASIGSLVAWRDERAGGLAWLEPAGATAAAPSLRAPGRVTTDVASPVDGGSTNVSSARPALLVRSAAYAPGWTARLRPLAGGPARLVAVRRLGLVQAVPVPPGRYEVTWRYAPSSILRGLAASVLGLAGIVALVVLAVLATWRSRGARRTAGSEGQRHANSTREA